MPDPARVREIVEAASRLPAESQTVFVRSACGTDKELLGAVQHELDNRTREAPLSGKTPADNADDLSGGFSVGDPEGGDSSDFVVGRTAQHLIRPGALIAGRYKLVRIVGEGGMGSVWLAEQTEPVRRNVAVKIIKAGVDSSQVVARFEAERQALAVMDHQNIARILDGGTYEPLGIPFFVMELVDGIPINRYCDQQRLSLRQRLELFIPVCEAIQHAHQKGIIHRDIKPSNILVGVNDGRPFPKVIDFGVAKATGWSLTDKTLDTAFGAIVGTPQYMSPEQASSETLDIDTRTDVYSLGVVLYELLTGSLPFDKKRLGRAAIFEILRIIREEEPSTPSSKLSTDEGLPSISANRDTEPIRLARMVRGELDWIVMKALEKDRTRRYDSASGFASDVRRFLQGEPVVAAPPGRWYRFKKLVRRNRSAVIAASLLAVSLVAGITGTAIGLWNARVERNSAIEAREAEVEQRKQAEAATQQAFLALQSFTDEFVERQFASRTILTSNDRNILHKALAQWELFADAQGDSAQAKKIRAEGRFRVAKLRETLGEHADAGKNFQEAVNILAGLAEEESADAEILQRLVEARIGLAARMRIELRREPAIQQLDLALKNIAAAQRIQPDSPDLRLTEATAWSARGVVLRANRSIDQANLSYARAEEILSSLVVEFPDRSSFRRQLATLHNNQANLLLADGQYADAEKHFRAGLGLRQELVAQDPDDPGNRDALSDSHFGLGDWYERSGEVENCLAEYQLALKALQNLNDQFPLVPEYRLKMASLHHNVSIGLEKLGDADGRKSEIEKSAGILERLVTDFPDVAAFQKDLARERSSLGNVLLAFGDFARARTEMEFSVDAFEKLVQAYPQDAGFRLELARSLDSLVAMDMNENKFADAKSRQERSAEILNQLLKEDPGDPAILQSLGDSYWNLAGKLFSANRLADAVDAYNKTAELKSKLVELQPENPKCSNELCRVKMLLGLVYQAQKKLPEASEQYEQAMEIAQRLVDQEPDNISRQLELAGGLTNLSLIQKEMESDLASGTLERASSILESLAKAHPEKTQVQIPWSGNLVNRSDALIAAGYHAGAIVLLDEAIGGLQKVVSQSPRNDQARGFLFTAMNRRAESLDATQRFADAAKDWELLGKFVQPGEETLYQSKTAQSLVKAGETDRAIEIAESLATVQRAPTIFARARIHAMAFGNEGEESQALRSVELLSQLVKMGLDDVDRLRNDPDLQSLQDRQDFLKLLGSIKQ